MTEFAPDAFEPRKREAPMWFTGDDVEAFLVKAADRPGKYLQGLGRPSPYTPLQWIACWIAMQDRWVSYESTSKVFGMSESTVRKFCSGNSRPRLYEALAERIPEFSKEMNSPKVYKAKRRFTRPTGNAQTRQRQCAENDFTVWGATNWQSDCPPLDKCLAKAEEEIARRGRETDIQPEIRDLN